MPKQEKHADPDSLLGQLQRGRGEAYRRILGIPKTKGWDLLLDCICNDPRLDSQVENRAEFYAALVIETDMELEPVLDYVRAYDNDEQGWNTPLAVETLGELARRGYKDSACRLSDYVDWGQWWDWILNNLCAVQDPALHREIAHRVEVRYPEESQLEEALAWFNLEDQPWVTLARYSARISGLRSRPRRLSGIAEEQRLPSNASSFTVGDLLALADEKNRHKVRKVMKQAVKLSDLNTLKDAVSVEKPFISDVALAGIAHLGHPSVLPWLIGLWSANPEMPGFLRARMCEAFVALGPELTLPLARERLHHPDWHERHLAEELFEAHATPADIPLLRNAIMDALQDDCENCYRICNLVQAFSNLPNCGPIPELISVFVRFRYSYGRGRAAAAIHVTSPDFFVDSVAGECLWDCEATTRALAAKSTPLETAAARARLGEMASDLWEDEDVRTQARARVTKG